MKKTSKCSQCLKEQCPIRSNLHKTIQEVIKNAEAEVKRLAPKEIDYMILTDISIIPTGCENYQGRQESLEERDRLFISGNDMAPMPI